MSGMEDARWRAEVASGLLVPWASGEWPGAEAFVDSLTETVDRLREPFAEVFESTTAGVLLNQEINGICNKLDGALTMVRDLIDQISKATAVDRAGVFHQLQNRYREVE